MHAITALETNKMGSACSSWGVVHGQMTCQYRDSVPDCAWKESVFPPIV